MPPRDRVASVLTDLREHTGLKGNWAVFPKRPSWLERRRGSRTKKLEIPLTALKSPNLESFRSDIQGQLDALFLSISRKILRWLILTTCTISAYCKGSRKESRTTKGSCALSPQQFQHPTHPQRVHTHTSTYLFASFFIIQPFEKELTEKLGF